MQDPLILTLQFDAKTADFFQEQRDRYFPPALNQVPAHLTLFHHLPGEEMMSVLRTVGRACAAREPFEARVAGLVPLGRGVAYKLESGAIARLRKELAAAFESWLRAQDRQGFRPHVTVQNKVDPKKAKALLAELQAGFSPFDAVVEGVQLWHYRGGPWEPAGAIGFGG